MSIRKNTITIVVIACCLCCQVKGQIRVKDSIPGRPEISIRIPDHLYYSETELRKHAPKLLAVFSVWNDEVSSIPLLGSYRLSGRSLFFIPQHKLGEGLRFEIQCYNRYDTVKKRFTTPSHVSMAEQPAEVFEVLPLNDKVPVNVLLFNIVFNKPMLPDPLAFKYIKLLDKTGKEKEMAWRNKSYWISDSILVMMIHPGRVKRGIRNFSALGDLFIPGEEYTLLITGGIHDVQDQPISKEYARKFMISGFDDKMPVIDYESFSIPELNTKDSLQIVFSEGMDYVSVLTGIKVTKKETGDLIEGRISRTVSDSTWIFIPQDNWQDVTYEVIFGKELSDFCGNHLYRPFEITDLKNLNEESMPRRWSFKPRK